MKQVTGSSAHPNRELSIQLRLDGDSFSMPNKADGESEARGECRAIHLLSHRTVLAPLSLVEVTSAEELVQQGGITLCSSDRVITIVGDQNVALIATSAPVVAALTERFGEDAPYISPILRSPLNEKSHVVIYCAEQLTYINIFSAEKMTFAEVFLSPTHNDTLYWLSRIGEAIPLEQYTIYVANEDQATAKFLSLYFKHVEICE